MQNGVIQLLVIVLSFVFSFWPFVILSAFTQWKGRNFSRLFIVALKTWVFLAVIRVFMWFTSTPTLLEIFIKEPANTIWFFIVGVILIALWTGNKYLSPKVDNNKKYKTSSVKPNTLRREKQYGHPNIITLLERMDDALSRNDYAGVLHTSASIFETMAKDVVGKPSVQNKTLKQFFEGYRNTSSLPPEILSYIKSIYEKRNTTPLAGHGSIQIPSISKQDAITLSELTRAFVNIEYKSRS